MEEASIRFLEFVAGVESFGIDLIRIAIFIIFGWIGALKFCNYEAEGMVPLIANSPLMRFFYIKRVPEYKKYNLEEGEFNQAKHDWHVKNHTYKFSKGLGVIAMLVGTFVFLGIFLPVIGLVGETLTVIMAVGTLSFIFTTPEVWVANSGNNEHSLPLLSNLGQQVIKNLALITGAFVALCDSANTILANMIANAG